jgi:hypothetical protein
VSELRLDPGTPVVLFLHSPREKVFGVLLSLDPAGVAVRGLDLDSFEDWMQQEARGAVADSGLSLVSVFYPMGRIERVERDESVGVLEGFTDRFARLTGRSLLEATGFRSPEKPR